MAGNVKTPKTMEEFGQQIKQATLERKLIVIFFSANWSRKCEYMLDQIEGKLAADHNDVDFIVVEIEHMLELQWDWRIDCFPTFVLLKQERVVEMLSGPFPNELDYAIETLKNRTVYDRYDWFHPKYEQWPSRRLKRELR